MRTKTFKKADLTIKFTNDAINYDEAVKNTPKGWRMIKPSEAMRIIEEYKNSFLYWFWCENPKWNKQDWRPVGRGDYGRFLLSSDYDGRGASRGVYVKDR